VLSFGEQQAKTTLFACGNEAMSAESAFQATRPGRLSAK
jgi:hypothetical protein